MLFIVQELFNQFWYCTVSVYKVNIILSTLTFSILQFNSNILTKNYDKKYAKRIFKVIKI